MRILAAAGDIGGLRALTPALQKMLALGHEIIALDHRGLLAELPQAISLKVGDEIPSVDLMVFSTSVTDPVALELARACRAKGIRVECILDNWMNYGRRMEIDDRPRFVPDAYYMMDGLAKEAAIEDGLPESCLVVSGHPGLASMAQVNRDLGKKIGQEIRHRWSIPEDYQLLLFVSEPAAADQGTDDSFPRYRGYTEQQVLKTLCQELLTLKGKLALCVLPHPREVHDEVVESWKSASKNLLGGVLKTGEWPSRELLGAVSGVSGMSSILLYEAWLQGIPTLSLQPGLKVKDLALYQRREGVFCVEKTAELSKIATWIEETKYEKHTPRTELQCHAEAVNFLVHTWTTKS